jgi:hypothetical protein
MKCMISWFERPQGSALEYENAQKRILQLFVVRVGEWGGHMLVETSDTAAIHRLCSTFPAFEFRVHPVLDIQDAVNVELEAIAWRDALKAS